MFKTVLGPEIEAEAAISGLPTKIDLIVDRLNALLGEVDRELSRLRAIHIVRRLRGGFDCVGCGRGSDVQGLQERLKTLGYFPKEVRANGNFGPATRASLQRFQCAKLQVCAGTPETTGYGATGPRTRAALK